MTNVLSYGGGRQTVAMLLLVRDGVLPRPDRIVIADTGREKSSTWEYLEEIAQPIAQSIGLTIEVAPRSLAYVDLYAHNGDLLVPVYTRTGKLPAFCSTEWKARVVSRHLRAQGITQHTSWIGFAYDERQRIKGRDGRAFPLVDAMLTKADCRRIIADAGLPLPPRHRVGCVRTCVTPNGDTSATTIPLILSAPVNSTKRSALKTLHSTVKSAVACGCTTHGSHFAPRRLTMTTGARMQ